MRFIVGYDECKPGEYWVRVISRFRRVLIISPLSISLEFEYEEYDRKGVWYIGARYYTARLRWKWRWERTHMYYDGLHELLSLGPLLLTWQGDWCDKCFGEEEPDG